MRKIKQYQSRIIKYTIGGLLALVVAEIFHLNYAISTVTITLLTIQNTKKETLQVSLRRMLSFVVAVGIAMVVFPLLSYTPISFGVFLLFFSTACFSFKIQDGFVSSTVLMTHLYTEGNIGIQIILNEVWIMLIGVAIGVGLNLYMGNNRDEIKENQKQIESLLEIVLLEIALLLENKESEFDRYSKELVEVLQQTKKKSIENRDNTLISDTTYYIEYVAMRMHQVEILNQIHHSLLKVEIRTMYAKPLASFIQHIAFSLDEFNSAKELMEQINELRRSYELSQLPKTRLEFEERAILYSVLLQLENFLAVKNKFALVHQSEFN